MKVYPFHINDPEFAELLVDSFLEISASKKKDPSIQTIVSDEHKHDFHDVSQSKIDVPHHQTIDYSLSDFPDAKPGIFCITSMTYLKESDGIS